MKARKMPRNSFLENIADKLEAQNKPRHTPTPWYVDKPFLEEGLYISGGTTELIAKIKYENKANAAFIVLAVNAHEELTQKLYEAFYTLKRGDKPEKWWFDEIEKLLAKAEGK